MTYLLMDKTWLKITDFDDQLISSASADCDQTTHKHYVYSLAYFLRMSLHQKIIHEKRRKDHVTIHVEIIDKDVI